MTLPLFLFIVGFIILIKGADWLTDGSSAIARKLQIPNFVVGVVIVGIGTSIPEFSISFLANIVGEGDIGLGTIVGSNIFNILFILGLSALFVPLHVKRAWVHRDLWWNMLAVAFVALFALLPPYSEGMFVLSRLEGLALFGLFLFWVSYVIWKSNGQPDDDFTESFRIIAAPIAFIMILAGLIGVLVGGTWVVEGAKVIARDLGLSESLIGLTVVGIGTSLPELVVSLAAALKRMPGIVLGNIIGSNIFDFLMILGFGAFVRPVVFPAFLLFDMLITLLAAAFLLGSMYVDGRYRLDRWQGALFVVLYLAYFGFLVWRG